jgi:hypothetical protein
VAGAEPLLIGRRDAFREFLHRSVEGGALHALLQLQVELVDDVAHDELGLDDAGRHSFAEAADHLVDRSRILAVPLEVVLIILDRLERRRALAGGKVGIEGVEAEEVIERPHRRQCEQLRLDAAELHLRLPFEDVVGELVRGRQGIPVDGGELAKLVLPGGPLGGEIGVADAVAEPVGIAHVAPEQGAERIAPEIVLVARLEQAVEVLARVANRSRCGRGILRLGLARHRLHFRPGAGRRAGGKEHGRGGGKQGVSRHF